MSCLFIQKKISARQLEKITKNAMFYAKIED